MATVTITRRTPPVNATLTQIAAIELEDDGGGGTIETYTEKWSGEAPAYATERTEFAELASAIVTDQRIQVVIPSDLIAAEVPDFGIGHYLRYSHAGRCTVLRVTAVDDRRDYGFIRCWTSGDLNLPGGTPDPCVP